MWPILRAKIARREQWVRISLGIFKQAKPHIPWDAGFAYVMVLNADNCSFLMPVVHDATDKTGPVKST